MTKTSIIPSLIYSKSLIFIACKLIILAKLTNVIISIIYFKITYITYLSTKTKNTYQNSMTFYTILSCNISLLILIIYSPSLEYSTLFPYKNSFRV